MATRVALLVLLLLLVLLSRVHVGVVRCVLRLSPPPPAPPSQPPSSSTSSSSAIAATAAAPWELERGVGLVVGGGPCRSVAAGIEA